MRKHLLATAICALLTANAVRAQTPAQTPVQTPVQARAASAKAPSQAPNGRYAAKGWADRIVLFPGADASREMAVAWRTDTRQTTTEAQIALDISGPSLARPWPMPPARSAAKPWPRPPTTARPTLTMSASPT